MPIPTRSILVSREGADLNLDNGTTHQLVVWNPQTLEWRRNAIVGRYQAGERLVNAVPEVALIGGVIRCMGDDWSDVDDSINEMYTALQQFEYTVTATFNGVSIQHTHCQPALIQPLNSRLLVGNVASGFQDFDIQIRCTPNVGSMP